MSTAQAGNAAQAGLSDDQAADRAGQLVAVLHERYARTERYGENERESLAFADLHALVDHAARFVPFYADTLANAGIRTGDIRSFEDYARVPVLRRADLQRLGRKLVSRASRPPEMRELVWSRSSGATGTPVEAASTAFNLLVDRANVYRLYRWHGIDFTRRMALIVFGKGVDARYPDGAADGRWGDRLSFPCETGDAVQLDISTPVDEQLEWLERVAPDYLLTFPSNLAALIARTEHTGNRPRALGRVMTIAEVVTEELRTACREAWGVEIVDHYSAQETGPIALQSPASEEYFVLADKVHLEILDEADRPVAPGGTGRVVVTPLHNYAMPLLRYDIGDYATLSDSAGDACEIRLPRLARINGRVRNMMRLPDGNLVWPSFGVRGFRDIAPVRQHQFAQVAPRLIEARLVTERPLTQAEEAALAARMNTRFRAEFEFEFVYRDEIPRQAGGKFEDFICLLNAPDGAEAVDHRRD